MASSRGSRSRTMGRTASRSSAVGIRTIWNPAPQFDIGLEVFYTQLETKHDPGTTRLTFAGSGGRAAGNYIPSSENVWGSILRMQRNFWP